MYNEISNNKRRTWVLMLSFVALVAALGWVISKVYAQPDLLLLVGGVSIVYALTSYFAGAKMALAVNGAREITKQDNPRLWRIVENLSITNGLPMPRVYIMDDPSPNAFATGRNPNKSAVCATTGILEIMDDSELEGVMAHEMGHVQNYDIRVNTIAFALVGIISLIADFFLRFLIFGGGEDEEGGSSGSGLFFILGIVAAVLAPIAATLLQLAISRRREYLADATGAMTTRYPDGLARALEKIGQYGRPMQKQNTSTAHMFFSNPLKKGSLMSIFSTHPPLEDRIAKLHGMKLQ